MMIGTPARQHLSTTASVASSVAFPFSTSCCACGGKSGRPKRKSSLRTAGQRACDQEVQGKPTLMPRTTPEVIQPPTSCKTSGSVRSKISSGKVSRYSTGYPDTCVIRLPILPTPAKSSKNTWDLFACRSFDLKRRRRRITCRKLRRDGASTASFAASPSRGRRGTAAVRFPRGSRSSFLTQGDRSGRTRLASFRPL